MIETVKDTLPGFLSHYLPSRKSGKGWFFDSLKSAPTLVSADFSMFRFYGFFPSMNCMIISPVSATPASV